jgi:hypothetical protein
MDEKILTMKREVVGGPSVVSDLVQNVDQEIYERRHFTISETSYEFPHISCTLLYEIIIVRLGCHKLYPTWFPKMLTGAHKNQRMVSDLTLF